MYNSILCFVAGKGAMAEVLTIVSVVKQYLQRPNESSQKTVTSHFIVETSGTKNE